MDIQNESTRDSDRDVPRQTLTPTGKRGMLGEGGGVKENDS
jgi:hypothetical protein